MDERTLRLGHADDIGMFAEHHGEQLMRAAYLLSGDRESAQDLVQGVLLGMMRADLIKVENPVAYARRALVNAYLNETRRRPLTERVLRLLRHQPVPTAVEVAVTDRELIRSALSALTVRQRTAVVLRYYEDLSDADIAEQMDCSQPTVRSLPTRARTRLRSHLDEPLRQLVRRALWRCAGRDRLGALIWFPNVAGFDLR